MTQTPHEHIIPISIPTPFIIGPVNAFLIKSDPLILVDTGPRTDDAYDALATALRREGLEIADIEVILITHGHIDHIGLLGRLVEESGAESYALDLVARQSQDYEDTERRSREFMLKTFRQFGVPQPIIDAAEAAREGFRHLGSPARIDHGLQDGERVLGFEVIHVPGHSASDTIFFQPELRFAFTGDHVLKGVNPTPLMRRDADTDQRAKSLLQYERSLARTKDLDIAVCYPGHGDPIHDHVSVIERIQQRHEKRTQKLLDLLRARAMTPFEASQALFPELAPEHAYLGLSTAIGHLDILEERGKARTTCTEGVWRYHAI